MKFYLKVVSSKPYIIEFAYVSYFLIPLALALSQSSTETTNVELVTSDSETLPFENLTTKISETLNHDVDFYCPLICNCKYSSANQQLDIICLPNSSQDMRSNNNKNGMKLELSEGVRRLSISNVTLDSNTIAFIIPNLQENTITELQLHQVTVDPFSFFNSQLFQRSKLSMRIISIYGAIVPLSEVVSGESRRMEINPFSILKKLDSLTICDSSPYLSNILLRAMPVVNHITVVNSTISEIHPESFAHLVTLQSLNLSHNQIQTIPARLVQTLWNLKTFDISHNHIEHLQEQVFVGLGSLRKLNVSHNNIRYIDTEVFTPLESIQVIDLGHNDVIQFFEPYFKKNGKLRVLLMSNTWVAKTFRNQDTASRSRMEIERLINTLQTVETFDLSDNDMTIIPETLTHAPQLTRVYLQGNRWECTCQDRWLLDWIYTTEVSIGKPNTTDNLWCYSNKQGEDTLRFPFLKYLQELTTSCTIPNITARTPFKYYALMGEDTILQCHTQRPQGPTITWITPSKTYITNNSPSAHEFSDNQTVAINLRTLDDGALYIDNVTRTDYGLYLCIASYSDLNITHYVHLGVDVSIFADVKIMSIIIGWLFSLLFLLIVLLVQLVRNILNRFGINCVTANQARRVRAFFESMEQHNNSQLDWLRDNYNMQARRIKDNCFLQLERIRESYTTQTKNLSDIREYGTQQLHTMRDQYHDQVRKVSSYSAHQLCRVRENYLFQRNRVCKFSSHQLIRIRETYKWQAQTLNKILENLPRTLNFDTCRGMGACGRTDSIYLDDVTDFKPIDGLCQSTEGEEGLEFAIEKMEHISLLIPPEFMTPYLGIKSETAKSVSFAMENSCVLNVKDEEENEDKPCCSRSVANKEKDTETEEI